MFSCYYQKWNQKKTIFHQNIPEQPLGIRPFFGVTTLHVILNVVDDMVESQFSAVDFGEETKESERLTPLNLLLLAKLWWSMKSSLGPGILGVLEMLIQVWWGYQGCWSPWTSILLPSIRVSCNFGRYCRQPPRGDDQQIRCDGGVDGRGRILPWDWKKWALWWGWEVLVPFLRCQYEWYKKMTWKVIEMMEVSVWFALLVKMSGIWNTLKRRSVEFALLL